VSSLSSIVEENSPVKKGDKRWRKGKEKGN
jgi:hypothetical protein